MGSESEGEMLLDVQIIVIRCHELNQRSILFYASIFVFLFVVYMLDRCKCA
jgi:hypothetical protein